jgi:hypothetical protein
MPIGDRRCQLWRGGERDCRVHRKGNGFDLSDLAISSGALTGLSSLDGGQTWTAAFTPTADTDAVAQLSLVPATRT